MGEKCLCAFMCVYSYPSHDADSFSRQEAWVADFIIHNAVEHLLFIITWEWRLHTQMHKGGHTSTLNSIKSILDILISHIMSVLTTLNKLVIMNIQVSV